MFDSSPDLQMFDPRATSITTMSINEEVRTIDDAIINMVNICVNASSLVGEMSTTSLAIAEPEFPVKS